MTHKMPCLHTKKKSKTKNVFDLFWDPGTQKTDSRLHIRYFFHLKSRATFYQYIFKRKDHSFLHLRRAEKVFAKIHLILMRLNLPSLPLEMAMRNELYLKGNRAQKPTAATLHIWRRTFFYITTETAQQDHSY